MSRPAAPVSAPMMISVCDRRLSTSPRIPSSARPSTNTQAADDGGRTGGELECGQQDRDRAGTGRDHAEAGQDVEAEMAGLLRCQCLQALGVGGRELAVFDQLRQIEGDFHDAYRSDARNSPMR